MSGFGGLRVLVVEDEPVVAMCLEDMLEELDCETIGPAMRLAEGLALAGERSTPIAEALRRRGVPFAFASGYGTAPEGFETLPLIEKPYRTTDIDAALRTLLG
jgi:CheY-like chemotaxis protein